MRVLASMNMGRTDSARYGRGQVPAQAQAQLGLSQVFSVIGVSGNLTLIPGAGTTRCFIFCFVC